MFFYCFFAIISIILIDEDLFFEFEKSLYCKTVFCEDLFYRLESVNVAPKYL